MTYSTTSANISCLPFNWWLIFCVCLLAICQSKLSTAAVPGESLPVLFQEEDRNGYDAIHYLFDLLDEDDSGYVEKKETEEFLIKDELKEKGKQKDRSSQFHQDDPQITVDELWKSWSSSEVHNWTVEEVVGWLSLHVELPQYSENFRKQLVNGSLLPRLATNTPEFLSSVLGVKDPIHKRKVSLKAQDAVLFGSPRRDRFAKYGNWIVLVSIVIASCGIWFAISQRRKYENQMRQVSVDLDNFQQLEKQLQSMQEKVGKSDGVDEIKDMLLPADSLRLREAEEEISALRDALQRAEERNELRQWSAPVELELSLQKTYGVELQYFKGKRLAAENQLRTAKEECQKLQEQQRRLFGSLKIIHGSQMDNVDHNMGLAKAALAELAADIKERAARWSRIEFLTEFHIVNPNTGNAGFAPRNGQYESAGRISVVGDLPSRPFPRQSSSAALSHTSKLANGHRFSVEMDSYSQHSPDSPSGSVADLRRITVADGHIHKVPSRASDIHLLDNISGSDTRFATRSVSEDELSEPPSAVAPNYEHSRSLETETNTNSSPGSMERLSPDAERDKNLKKFGAIKKPFGLFKLHRKADH